MFSDTYSNDTFSWVSTEAQEPLDTMSFPPIFSSTGCVGQVRWWGGSGGGMQTQSGLFELIIFQGFHVLLKKRTICAYTQNKALGFSNLLQIIRW